MNTQYPGLALKLPTEAQWEYAARAGTAEARYGELDEIAWFLDNSDDTTHPVMEKVPNAWGLYDMLGNVWEWCHDWYGPYSSGPEIDPIGPSEGTYRVVRGGSWGYTAEDVRAADRARRVPSDRYSRSGFRLAQGQSTPNP